MLWEVARRWLRRAEGSRSKQRDWDERRLTWGDLPRVGEGGMRLPSELGPGCARYLLLRRLG
jgi:hypothetical protein